MIWWQQEGVGDDNKKVILPLDDRNVVKKSALSSLHLRNGILEGKVCYQTPDHTLVFVLTPFSPPIK